jgi:leader peptidase (prepilin peptidase)/N-methyltransferase
LRLPCAGVAREHKHARRRAAYRTERDTGTCLKIYSTDHKRLVIEDEAILLLGLLGLLQALLFPIGGFQFLDYVYGALISGTVFYLIYLISNRAYGGAAFGFGDVKLSVVIGLWISWHGVLLFLLLSATIGIALHGLFTLRRWRRGRRGPRVHPFGPGMMIALTLIVSCNLLGWTVAFIFPQPITDLLVRLTLY